MARGTAAAHGAALGTLAICTLAACAGHGLRLPRIGSHFMPPVVPYASDTLTLSGRAWHRLREPAYDLYVQSPTILALVDGPLQATTQEFTRHFGAAPRVAILVFDAPAEPTRDFDFAPFQAAGTQVLAFVRARKPNREDPLGIDDGLLRTRIAELFLASYADSVVGRATGRRDATSGQRAVDRLPHWFAEAVVSRVARPDAVEPGLAYVRANRLHLVPLKRLFGVARLGTPPWSELAATRSTAPPTLRAFVPCTPPPALLAAESTVFGEFLVDRYGPTFLQAVADELLLGVPTEQVLVTLPGGADDGVALERRWEAWLARR
jgi:hypothetical protein